jgi:hypothetical protein
VRSYVAGWDEDKKRTYLGIPQHARTYQWSLDASMPQIPITVLFNHYKATKNTSKKGCAHHHGSSGQSELRKSGQPPGKHEKKTSTRVLNTIRKEKKQPPKNQCSQEQKKKTQRRKKKMSGYWVETMRNKAITDAKNN